MYDPVSQSGIARFDEHPAPTFYQGGQLPVLEELREEVSVTCEHPSLIEYDPTAHDCFAIMALLKALREALLEDNHPAAITKLMGEFSDYGFEYEPRTEKIFLEHERFTLLVMVINDGDERRLEVSLGAMRFGLNNVLYFYLRRSALLAIARHKWRFRKDGIDDVYNMSLVIPILTKEEAYRAFARTL